MPPSITPGTLDTVYKVLDTTVDPVGLFQGLRRGPHAFLLESADLIEKYGDKSTGCVDPSLRITAKNGRFAVRALNARGRRYLGHLGEAFSFAVDVAVTDEAITGRVPVAAGFQDEDARLKSGDIFDVLRTVVFRLSRASGWISPSAASTASSPTTRSGRSRRCRPSPTAACPTWTSTSPIICS